MIAAALIFLAFSVWVIQRFRTEKTRIAGLVRDFNRDHPVREPGRGEL